MLSLYSHSGATPAPLPFRIRLSDGRLRTDPTGFTADEVSDAGYVPAPAPPAYDPATQHAPAWAGTAWTISNKTPAEIESDITAERQRVGEQLRGRVQGWLDQTVAQRHYSDIATCVTYEADPNPAWAAEGAAAKAWRSAVWTAFFGIVAAVEAGERAIPSETELLAQLPALEWPA